MGVTTLRLWRRAAHPPPAALPGATLVEAFGVSVSYAGVPILADVDLAVRAGEVLVLVGPNGAGKSTLLSVLAGDVRPDAGRVEIDGAPVSSWSPEELAMRRSVLLQQVGLSFPFTVTQVVRMGRAPWAGTDAEDLDDVIVAAAMDETEVTRFATRAFTSLSGGERARAALARVLAQEAVVLLLDEPTAALDIRHQEAVLATARARAAAGDAVVVVLHDLGAAAAFADRVVLMADGRVRAQGPPGAVLDPEVLSDVYGHPIEVLRHPGTGDVLVVPHRRR